MGCQVIKSVSSLSSARARPNKSAQLSRTAISPKPVSQTDEARWTFKCGRRRKEADDRLLTKIVKPKFGYKPHIEQQLGHLLSKWRGLGLVADSDPLPL